MINTDRYPNLICGKIVKFSISEFEITKLKLPLFSKILSCKIEEVGYTPNFSLFICIPHDVVDVSERFFKVMYTDSETDRHDYVNYITTVSDEFQEFHICEIINREPKLFTDKVEPTDLIKEFRKQENK